MENKSADSYAKIDSDIKKPIESIFALSKEELDKEIEKGYFV